MALAMLSGCASSVQYGDAKAVETVDVKFGSTDLQQIAAKMVESLVTFPTVTRITKDNSPVLYVDRIKNKTQEHIDTESVTDTIMSKLIRSGKFQFIDMSNFEDVKNQLGYQNNSGYVDPVTVARIGKRVGAEYMIYGNLSSIIKDSKSTKDVYYKFTLKMTKIETGIVIWQDEKEIRKSVKRSVFGL